MQFAPMLCSKAAEAFSDSEWSSELKVDGWRALVYVERAGVSIISRHGTQLREWFPNLQDIRKHVPSGVVLDGEIAAFDDEGNPKFDLLKRGVDVVFVAFDILKSGRRILLDRPLRERQAFLAKTVTDRECILRSRPFIGEGLALYNEVVARNLEGVVLKRLDSTYACGVRSSHWIKVRTPAGNVMIRERMRRAHSRS